MTKKQILAAKIAEREAKEKAAQDKKAEIAELTPAQRKIKIEEDELVNAAEIMDLEDPDAIDLNKWTPKSKHDYKIYTEAINNRLKGLSESPFYSDFVCDIVRELLQPMNLEGTRKVEQVIKAQINTLIKSSKGPSKGKKGKAKPGINAGGAKSSAFADTGENYDDDFDDFL